MADTKRRLSTQPKALDVISPGKSAPLSTSRPIIVTNRPMIKDPMAPEEANADVAATSTLLGPSSTVRPSLSKPLKRIESPTTAKEAMPQPHEETRKTDEALTDSISAPQPEVVQKPEPDQNSGKVSQGKETKVAQAAQEKIIESKQYFLPIATPETNGDLRRFLLLLLLFVLLASLIWLDLVLDAGILHIAGIKSLTHFFSVLYTG